MDVSSIYGFNSTVSLINSLYPTTRVSSLVGGSSVSSLLGSTSSSSSISSLGHLLSDVENLQQKSAALATANRFDVRSTASSQDQVATATASAGTALGTYQLKVEQLAQAQTLSTAALSSPSTSIGSAGPATISFQFASGEQRNVTLGSTGNTLSGIASAINNAGIGIQAKIVSSPGGYQLTLNGQAGADNAFNISVAGNSAVAGLLSYSPGSTSGAALTAQAQDAKGLINGNAFTASNNTVSTGVAGLTLNLNKIGETSLTVAPDTTLTKAAGALVDAYNAVNTSLLSLGFENAGLGSGLSALRSQLANTLGNASGLAQIGITSNSDGTLKLNSKKFETALNSNPDLVAGLFSNNGQGLAEKVQTLTEGSLSPTNLLQISAPNLNASSTSNDLLSYLGQFGTGAASGSTASLSSQMLVAQLLGSGSSSGNQGGNQFLESIMAQQSFNQNLMNLGTLLNQSRQS